MKKGEERQKTHKKEKELEDFIQRSCRHGDRGSRKTPLQDLQKAPLLLLNICARHEFLLARGWLVLLRLPRRVNVTCIQETRILAFPSTPGRRLDLEGDLAFSKA